MSSLKGHFFEDSIRGFPGDIFFFVGIYDRCMYSMLVWIFEGTYMYVHVLIMGFTESTGVNFWELGISSVNDFAVGRVNGILGCKNVWNKLVKSVLGCCRRTRTNRLPPPAHISRRMDTAKHCLDYTRLQTRLEDYVANTDLNLGVAKCWKVSQLEMLRFVSEVNISAHT